MPDLMLSGRWGGDLALTPSGDIATVDATELGIQRVVRRLFTPERGMLFHLDYGAGLPGKIGMAISARRILGLVRSQIFKEAAVMQNPAPQVHLREIPIGSGTQIVDIQYKDASSGAPQLVSFDTTPT